MPAPRGKVNESLSKAMSYKGDDGLSDAERKAHAICNPLSCRHAACYRRLMYSTPIKLKEECGPLMEDWKSCFARELRRLEATGTSPQAAPA